MATVGLLGSSITVCEGDDPAASLNLVCVGLSSPVDGIACDIVIILGFTEGTARKFGFWSLRLMEGVNRSMLLVIN